MAVARLGIRSIFAGTSQPSSTSHISLCPAPRLRLEWVKITLDAARSNTLPYAARPSASVPSGTSATQTTLPADCVVRACNATAKRFRLLGRIDVNGKRLASNDRLHPSRYLRHPLDTTDDFVQFQAECINRCNRSQNMASMMITNQRCVHGMS